MHTVDDALRQDERIALGEALIRIPVLGLHIEEDRFMGQVVRAYRQRYAQRAG